MLISIDKKFIFLANSKTGSTTIENALQRHSTYSWCDSPRAKHAPWTEVREAFSPLFSKPEYSVDKFFRFGVIREPADWLLSWYNYRRFRKNGGIPADMSFEKFWQSDDWVKRKSQAAHFLDDDGVCRFNLIIPMNRLRLGVLPQIFEAMGVDFPTDAVKNKSKGTLQRTDIEPSLWDEINSYFKEDHLMHQDWNDRFDRVFPSILEPFYGLSSHFLPPPPDDIRLGPEPTKSRRPSTIRIKNLNRDLIDFFDITVKGNVNRALENITLTGQLLLKPEAQVHGSSLLISDQNGERAVTWNLKSLAFSTQCPANPAASRCRFSATNISIQEDQTATLLLDRPGLSRLKIAELSR